MLDDLLFCLNTVMPTFLLIFAGWGAVRAGIVDRPFADRVGQVVFRFFLPIQIALNLYDVPAGTPGSRNSILFIAGGMVVSWAVIWVLANAFLRKKESVGAFVHSSFRGSISVMGVSIATSLAGEAGAAKCSGVAAAYIIVANILAVISLTRRDSGPIRLGPLLRRIVTNPLILGVAAGIVLQRSRAVLPGALNSAVRSLASLAIPASLLCIGAALDLSRMDGELKYMLLAALNKTVLIPAALVPAAALLGFRGIDLAVICIAFSLANPGACYVMTAAMGGDGRLAAGATVLSTLMSVVTITLFLFLLKTAALI